MARGKVSLAVQVTPRCERVAAKLGFELVDVETERDATGVTLRIYVDRPEGMDLDGCERYHRALIPLVEDLDYDSLEVSTPGIDRPLKTKRDVEKSLGLLVEARLYKPVDGKKSVQGLLRGMDEQTVSLQCGEETVELPRNAVAQVRLVPDLSALEENEQE